MHPGRLLAAGLLAAGLVPAAAARPAGGQTPFTGIGLGYPVPPVDARSAALGSIGLGLLGGTFSMRNPAELAAHPGSGIALSLAPEGVDVEREGGADAAGRNRFSVIRAVSRTGEWAVGVGFGSVLDQDFEVRFEDTLSVSVGRFPFEEVRRHDGGVSAIDVSVARRLGPLLVGAGAQRLTGSLRQSFTRRFGAEAEGSGITIENIFAETSLSYGAWRFTGGAALRFGERAMLGGSFGLAGEMEADVDTLPPLDPRTAPASRSFEMPNSAEAGGSVLLAPGLLVAAGAGWVGWSVVDGQFEDVRAADVRWGGAGVEFARARLLGVLLPLRLGARATDLPFFPEGREQPTERALSLGLGAIFRPDAGAPAGLSASLELGKRGDVTDVGLEESFRRLTLGLVLRT